MAGSASWVFSGGLQRANNRGRRYYPGALFVAQSGGERAGGMTPALQELATLDRVIHEPARLMIVSVLYAVKESDFLYLQRECGLTQGNLSSHLAKLEEANYVLIEKTFKGKYPPDHPQPHQKRPRSLRSVRPQNAIRRGRHRQRHQSLTSRQTLFLVVGH